MKAFFAVALCFLFASVQGQNLVEKLSELGLTSLVGYLEATGLDIPISSLGPFTIMAPTNGAFDELPDEVKALLQDPSVLAEVLTAHVFVGAIRAADLENDLLAATLQGSPIRFNIYDNGAVTANGALISSADQEADNGVIHVVEHALVPFLVNTIAADIAIDPDYSVLGALLSFTGLDSVLASPGPFTLFAPDDAAFDALPDGALEDLIQNPEALVNVLTYHVVAGTYFSYGVEEGQQLTTVQGGSVTLNTAAGSVNGAALTYVDWPCINGAFHAIDSVLLPGRK